VLLARGDPMHSGSPLILLRQLLRQAAGLDDVPEADRHEHLARHLARRLAPADLERAAEFLGDLAGAPPPAPGALLTTARRDPTLLGEQQRRALLAWLRAETAARPVVLVLEDLHWGDLPSIKLVDAALSALADRPLYVLGIGRPEVHDLFPGLFSARAVQEIRLGPLTRKASESLVRQALGQGADRATIDTLVERAAGHAYALEELIRAVAEGRSGALPETLLAMTQARLDTLGSEERRLLRAASIFGERFTGQGLAALLGSEEHSAEVELRLADLVERELLACDLQGSARVCTFRHSLLREGAYATLTPEDRTLGHLLAAEWLERTRERDALLVAQHFELGGQPARAAPWHLQAAQQALAANDFRAAIERAERGVRSGASGETLGALHLVSGRSHMAFADVVQAEAACHQALELLPRGSHRWYQAASVAIASELLHGVVPVMILEMARFEPEGPITTDEGEMTAWSLLVLWALGLADPLQRFVARLERRAHLLAPGDPAAAWLDFARAIRAHMIDDDAPTALRHLAAACAAFERVEDLRSQALAQWVTSYVLYGLQDARACERVARQALATAERLGLHFIKGATRRNLGWALAARGDVAAGCAELRAALAADISPSNRWGSGGAHAQLAEALLHAGQLDEAEREAQQALELAMIPGSQVRAWLLLGEVQLRTGRPHEALATARKAETLLGQASVPGYLLWSGDHLLARALAATGDPEGAALALARVHERLRAQAARFQDPAARRRFLLHHRAVLEQTDLPTAPRQGAPSH
jgi:tetratricopeptide (TPR) repeat protein